MRAQFIYEKFTEEDTDPIKDMGIGLRKFWEEEKERLWRTSFKEIAEEFFPEYLEEDGKAACDLADRLCDIFTYLLDNYTAQKAFNKLCLYNEFDALKPLNKKQRNIVANALNKHYGFDIKTTKIKK